VEEAQKPTLLRNSVLTTDRGVPRTIEPFEHATMLEFGDQPIDRFIEGEFALYDQPHRYSAGYRFSDGCHSKDRSKTSSKSCTATSMLGLELLTGRSWKPVCYVAAGGPNQVVSASASPTLVRSPTQATYPSGRTKTAMGAVTAPIAGSSHGPAYSASIN
jgi:hypothetical protein